ncbi:ATP-binding protein [Galactobacter caseinivorans]|uniref:biotin carboxylase n=1 Tax=Galactobacter caseinivorans TaxID=2676123 RepID=A0A496PK95_9MICC|nr:biotin carboxylase N-terminal domain-containing protein [Galactobacter caseinivorans]RKW70901.1 acetyl/propionyl-CoA carboxylase subunit alpha [Galactobacter caseinivorans]
MNQATPQNPTASQTAAGPQATSGSQTFVGTVLIANRGEIARRIIRSVHALGLRAVAVYSDADAAAAHVREADVAVRIGPAPAAQSYLDQDAVIAAAVATGADAVHPGYGFLSENAVFGQALERAGITFVGPNAEALDVMADKITAKNHVSAAGVPVTPGVAEAGLSDEQLMDRAAEVGYPLLIKPSAGGGGQGMVEVHESGELAASLASARRTARSSFGDDTLFLERLVTTPRHIEVQILADKLGNVVHLGERECSLQRRHQKVIEEAPAPLLEGLDDAGVALRARLGAAAVEAARSVNYVGAGTVEFLVSDERPDEFFFMEMNTRLQVEHPVTEEVVRVRGAALDLVAWQIRIAAGEALDFMQDEVELVGHAAEARVYAERPQDGFLPAVGPVRHVRFPSGPGVRVDAALDGPGEVSSFYDPMIAKVIASGRDRAESLRRLDEALAGTFVAGSGTNVDYLRRLISDPDVRAGRLDTGLIGRKPELTQPVQNQDASAVASVAAAHLEVRAGRAQALLEPLAPTPGSAAHPAASGRGAAAQRVSAAWGADGFRAGGPAQPVALRLRSEDGQSLDAELMLTANGAAGGTGSLEWSGGRVTRHAEATVQELRLVVDGAHAGAATLVHTGGAAPELWVHLDGTTLHVSAPLRAERTRLALAEREVEAGGGDPRALAPMTGTVSMVHASSGQHVSAGEPLLAIEAMKMEHAVLAPLDGVLTLHVGSGEQVAQGAVVATVEPHPEPHPERDGAETLTGPATAAPANDQEQS